jgi:hypothetical protein
MEEQGRTEFQSSSSSCKQQRRKKTENQNKISALFFLLQALPAKEN